MRRSFTLLASALFALSIVSAGSLSSATPVVAATVIAATTTCNNDTDNTPGLGAICEVTIQNTITAVGGSATVTVRECHGAAGDPEAACTTYVMVLTEPVTNVTQCNDSMNGGGGTLRCRVQITNTFVVQDPQPTNVTVNQCVGSGDGIANNCDPFPATTSGATITQCNGSANGGTLVELRCTATGTQSDAFSVTVNQCNGSTNGGGALVICSANIDTAFVPAPTAPPSAPTLPTDAPSAPPSAPTLPTDAPSAPPSAP
ncbi:MAG TPA: hypothetical protein VM344_08575, partial [Vitreimonas sp.]|nr:hypothetical protein [Vitreimonas sp.]